jgi:hypothetical protein
VSIVEALLLGTVGGSLVVGLIELAAAQNRKRRQDTERAEALKRANARANVRAAHPDEFIARCHALSMEQWASLSNEQRIKYRDSYYKTKGL